MDPDQHSKGHIDCPACEALRQVIEGHRIEGHAIGDDRIGDVSERILAPILDRIGALDEKIELRFRALAELLGSVLNHEQHR